MPQHSTQEKWFVSLSTAIFLVFTFLSFISQILFHSPSNPNGYTVWYVILLSTGLLGVNSVGLLISFRAWTKSANEYDDWVSAQLRFMRLTSETQKSPFEKNFFLWQATIAAPIILVVTITVLTFLIFPLGTRLLQS